MELNWPSCGVISCIQIDWYRLAFQRIAAAQHPGHLFFAKTVVFLTFDESPHPRRVNVHQNVRSAGNVLQEEKC